MDACDRYCSRCGTCLSPSLPSDEYRFVTVLCTDLSGYSILSERLDNEDLKDFMERVLSGIARIIIRFSGAVEKYIGDAVVALFGTQKAREGDPVRAILAAQEIHHWVETLSILLPDSFGIPVKMHTGLNSGEVLMDSGMARRSSHGTLGKTINIASRLCDMASQGEILIGEALVSEVMRYFHLEWMGRKILKGSRTPIHVYKVMSKREVPLAIHRTGGMTSPIVGRDHELSILLSKTREIQKGQGGVVSVIGDAGVVKSRLIQEVKGLLDDGFIFITAVCHDHASSIPYYPFMKLVLSLLGHDGEDKDAPDITQALMRDGLSQEYAGHLAVLVDRTIPPESKGCGSPDIVKEKLSDAMLVLLNAKASGRPAIFCFEDLHWADQSTMDLLSYLIHNWEKACPCLLLLSYRAGVVPAFPGLRLSLRELSEPEVGRMLTLMFDAEMIPERTVHSLAEATGGNPFFIEEMMNYLVEKGIDPTGRDCMDLFDDVPTTLYGLISSRLDHMDAVSKRIIQEASLIGRMFSGGLLASVSSHPDAMEASLHEAIKHGFIKPWGEGEYMFKHDITRDVAGRTLLKHERKRLHGKIARALEEGALSSSGDYSQDLAHHFGRAGEYKKAVYYHIEAGKHCQASGAWEEAGAQFSLAEYHVFKYTALHDKEERLVEIREGIWRCYRVFNPARAIAALDALGEYYRHRGHEKEEAFCFIRLINLYSQKGLFAKAKECYTYALSLIGNDLVMIAAAQTAIAYTYTYLGRPNDALVLLDGSRSALQSSDQFLFTVNALTTLAAYVWKGDMKNASFWYEQTKSVSGSHLDIDLMADMWLAHIYCLEGRFNEAGRVFDEVSLREKKLGRLAGGLSYLRIQGSIYFRSRYFGDILGARSDLEAFNSLGMEIHNSDALKGLYRAWIALEEGNPWQTKELINAALPGLKEGVANRVPYALNTLAEANLRMGDPIAAHTEARESIAWNEKSGNVDQLIWGLRIFAEACTAQGLCHDAHKSLRLAYSLAGTSGMKPHLAWIMAAWGNLLKKKGRNAKALICFRKSLNLWNEMDNKLQIKRVTRELKCIENALSP
ncbi:MAG TPA: AAA family ATPase [Desulfomonilia bacterium]|nr:AAA family ATPase [Desulfomonilia bacterium]